MYFRSNSAKNLTPPGGGRGLVESTLTQQPRGPWFESHLFFDLLRNKLRSKSLANEIVEVQEMPVTRKCNLTEGKKMTSLEPRPSGGNLFNIINNCFTMLLIRIALKNKIKEHLSEVPKFKKKINSTIVITLIDQLANGVTQNRDHFTYRRW